jgi:hypothetical protein
VEVEYDGSRLLEVLKIDDEEDVHTPPFSMLYFDLHTYSGILALENAIRVIKVRYEENEDVFDSSEEKVILQQFSDYIFDKNPDIIISMRDYDNGKAVNGTLNVVDELGVSVDVSGWNVFTITGSPWSVTVNLNCMLVASASPVFCIVPVTK